MTRLHARIHTHAAAAATRATAARSRGPERGASTIEIVFWAAGLLVLAGIVYAAINAYIQSKIGGIR